MSHLFNRVVWYIEREIPLPIWLVREIQKESASLGCADINEALQFLLYNHPESTRFGVIRKIEIVNSLTQKAKFALKRPGLQGNELFIDLIACGDSLSNIRRALLTVFPSLSLEGVDLTALKGHPEQQEILHLFRALGLGFDEMPLVEDAIKFFDPELPAESLPEIASVQKFLERYYEHPQMMDVDVRENFWCFHNNLVGEEKSPLFNLYCFVPTITDEGRMTVLRQIFLLRNVNKMEYLWMARNLSEDHPSSIIPRLFNQTESGLESHEACQLLAQIVNSLLVTDEETEQEDKEKFLAFLQEIKKLSFEQIKQIFSAKTLSGSVVLVSVAERYPMIFLDFFNEIKSGLSGAELISLLTSENSSGKTLMDVLNGLPPEHFNLINYYKNAIKPQLNQQEIKQFLLHKSSSGEGFLHFVARDKAINFLEFFRKEVEEELTDIYNPRETLQNLCAFDREDNSVMSILLTRDFAEFRRFYQYLSFMPASALRECWMTKSDENTNLLAVLAVKHPQEFILFYQENVKPLFARRDSYYISHLDEAEPSLERAHQLRNLLFSPSHSRHYSAIAALLVYNPQNFIQFYREEVSDLLYDPEFFELMGIESESCNNALAHLAEHDLQNFISFYRDHIMPRFARGEASWRLKDLIKHNNSNGRNLPMIIAKQNPQNFYEFFDGDTRNLFENDEEVKQLYCQADKNGDTLASHLAQDGRVFVRVLTDLTELAHKKILTWDEVYGDAFNPLAPKLRNILSESELPQAVELRRVLENTKEIRSANQAARPQGAPLYKRSRLGGIDDL